MCLISYIDLVLSIYLVLYFLIYNHCILFIDVETHKFSG